MFSVSIARDDVLVKHCEYHEIPMPVNSWYVLVFHGLHDIHKARSKSMLQIAHW